MKKQNTKDILNLTIISIFLIALFYISIRYAPAITNLVKSPDKFRVFLLSYGKISMLIFILFQIIQVVIAVIPGEFMQLAGGYVYGTILGSILSSFGILLGTMIVFYIVRILGLSSIKLFVSEKNLKKFDFLMNNKKLELAVFILFIIPGLPKDILTYIAGLTPINHRKFFIITTIARFPSLFVSSYVGSSLQDKQYTEAIIISVLAAVILIIVYFKKDKLIEYIKK